MHTYLSNVFFFFSYANTKKTFPKTMVAVRKVFQWVGVLSILLIQEKNRTVHGGKQTLSFLASY